MVGTSAWVSALMRVLRRPISAVSRCTARTRRSSDALARLPNSTAVGPEGATSGSRARVSASMPLLLACRARKRRRAAALAEVIRSTVWPRRPKNTAIGSHAGPVGSMTTTSRVAGSAPASALVSRAVSLSTVGRARRRAQALPVLSSTTAACSLVTPRSRPSKRTGTGAASRLLRRVTNRPTRLGEPNGAPIAHLGPGAGHPARPAGLAWLPLMCCSRARS
jgi:hypothetical protein